MNRQGFIKCSLSAAAMVATAGFIPQKGNATKLTAPANATSRDNGLASVKALPAGGTIGIIAPAGPATGQSQACRDWCSKHGYNVHIFPSVEQTTGYLAGSDHQRLSDLHAAFSRQDIDAILCLRGGYGSPRLLDKINYDLIRTHAKPFVGYSDITALHSAFARFAGFVTFHGPMMVADLIGKKMPPTESSLLSMLKGEKTAGDVLVHPKQFPLTTIAAGVASGRLVGGNLAMINALLGTPYEIDTEDAILLIEDVSEPLYRIDRLLTQLRLAKKLSTLRGVLVGDFDKLTVQDLTLLLKDTFAPDRIPVLAGWRSGHCDPNITLPLGARVTLDAGAQEVKLAQVIVEDGTKTSQNHVKIRASY